MSKRSVFLFFTLIFFMSGLFAEKITFSVNAEETGHANNIPVTTEWSDSWFGSYSPFEYHHDVARIAAVLSECSYVNEKLDPELNIMKNVYRAVGVRSGDMEFHYDLDYSKPGLGINQAAFSLALKEISTSKGKAHVVFVTIRGTPFSAPEWISNVNVSDSNRNYSEIHEGFFRTENIIHNALIYFLLKNKVDPDNCYLLITGHSRGAALSNLLGAKLCDDGYFKSENMFVYTFAAPNVTQEEKVTDPKYNFIWNIINPEDVVPSVPMKRNNWKFAKYGQSKVFISFWDTDDQLYKDNLSRVNKMYSQFMGRDYYPFYTGTYIPSIITRLLTDLYPTMKDYYRSPIALRPKTDKIFYDIYPENPPETPQNASPTVFDKIGESVNKSTNGLLSYSENAFLDMHLCSMYLSWMMSLSESEMFTDTGSSRIIINGAYQCAVFDENDEVMTRVIEGVPDFKSIKVPVVCVPFKEGVVIGVPSKKNYTVVVYKDSLLPTPVSVTIEHYDAEGYLIEACPKEKLYPNSGEVYVMTVGKETLNQTSVSAKKYGRKEANQVKKSGKLKEQDFFRIQPEFTLDTEFDLEGGIRFGSRSLHGTVITGQTLTDLGNSLKLDLGIGHEHALIGPSLLSIDFYSNLIWAIDDGVDDNKIFNYVPSLRFSVAFKPFRRFSLFTSAVFDFHIDDFNDGAFYSGIRNQNLGHLDLSDSVHAVPSFRFGLRF